MSNKIEEPTNPKNLFIKDPLNITETIPDESEKRVIPLGEFSEFILSEQPKLLTAVRNGNLLPEAISQRQRELIREVNAEDLLDIRNHKEQAQIALLDLSFAMSAVTFSEGTVPEEIQILNSELSAITGLPEMMTFEKIVNINSRLPFNQIRTFTDGPVGNSERRFYYGHELMNVKMQDTINAVIESVELLNSYTGNIDRVLYLLKRGANNMEEFAKFMKSFMKMPREHFGVFRQYLSQYPDKTRNASGAFLGIPRLDIRLVGLTPKYEEFLDEGMRYFPVAEQEDIQYAQQMAKQDKYLVKQYLKLEGEEQKGVAKALVELIEPIRDFRLGHLAAVMHFVPGALGEGLKGLKSQLMLTEEEPILDDESSDVKGTAGFLPGPLLRNIIRMDMRALEELNNVIND
jgi:hypothetical protein